MRGRISHELKKCKNSFTNNRCATKKQLKRQNQNKLQRSYHCDHSVTFLSHRCPFSFKRNSSCNFFPSLEAILASTFLTLRMPGMIVCTSSLQRINRNAMSGMVRPEGINGLNASAWSTLEFRFSGTK